MKEKLLSVLLGMALLLGLTFSASAAPVLLDGIAAIVNKNIITQSELSVRIETIKAQLTQQKIQIPPPDVLQKQVLDLMINQVLENQMINRLNITVTSTDLKNALNSFAAQKGMTVAELQQTLQKQGLSEEAFLTQFKEQVALQKLLSQVVASQVTVTPEEINDAMALMQSQASSQLQYHLYHIVIPIPNSPTQAESEAAENKASNLLTQLNGGADFKMLAAANSTGEDALEGGDMGWKFLTEIPEPLADKIASMQPGSVIGPFQIGNSFQLIYLSQTRQGQAPTDNKTLRAQVTQMIFSRKAAEKEADWLSQLRASAYIKIFI
jgi:peptidyl-prolyl cis-trans isomerase SurA